ARSQLRDKLQQSQEQLAALNEASGARQLELETQIYHLQAAKLEVQQKLEQLTSALAEETNRRTSAEREAAKIAEERKTSEAELSENIRSLNLQLRERQDEVGMLESSLRSEVAQRRQKQSEIEALEK